MTLGDLGAQVIKVEQPGSGDETRGWGPPFDADGQSAYYLSVNRNKASIALDLASDHDREILLRLIQESDVVLENFRTGVLERHGIHRTELLDKTPQLIWCTISGFGAASYRPGYDFVVQAESGWMSVTGEPHGEPVKVGIALADVITGKDAAIGVLGALLARALRDAPLPASERTVEISLSRSATAALVNVAQSTLVSGEDAGRWGNAHPNLVPYQMFRAKDRPIVIAVGNDRQWAAACLALGLEELGRDPALAQNPARVRARDRVVAAFAARVAEREASDLLGRLGAAGVPCGVVRTVKEAIADADVSPVTGIAPPVPGQVRFPPPRLDEHGEAIRRYGWLAFQHHPALQENS